MRRGAAAAAAIAFTDLDSRREPEAPGGISFCTVPLASPAGSYILLGTNNRPAPRAPATGLESDKGG